MGYKLTGRTIRAWELTPDQTAIDFTTDAGPISYETEGDCCSHTWINSIENAEALRGRVYNVEDIDLPDNEIADAMARALLGNEYESHGDVIRFYGLRITTEHGHVIIDYRNSSNGYYGGSIHEVTG